jgi:hypothetical protein
MGDLMIRLSLFVNVLLCGALWSQSAAPASNGAKTNPAVAPSSAPAAKPAAAATPYRNQPDRLANRATAYYEAVWGIEAPNVKAVESGVILRFSYRVIDPEKAKALSDKKVDPVLVSPEKGIKLVIPTMEKVGQLRQAPHELEAGKSYWMAFSNSGRLLKPGDRVDIVIGNFRAQGLLVE